MQQTCLDLLARGVDVTVVEKLLEDRVAAKLSREYATADELQAQLEAEQQASAASREQAASLKREAQHPNPDSASTAQVLTIVLNILVHLLAATNSLL